MPSQSETVEATQVSTLEGAARIKQLAVQQIKWSREYIGMLVQGMTDEQLMHRAGSNGNHAIWILGHLAVSDDQILAALTGTESKLSETLTKQFIGGSEPSDNRSDYPSRESLLATMQQTHERFIDWVESLDEESMNKAAPEFLQPFAPDAISTAFSVSAHDLCHAGQISTARASLGIPRMM